MDDNEQKEYEKRVKRRVLILRGQIKAGKIKFSESMRGTIEKVFY